LVTPNPEFVVYAHRQPWFRQILNSADFAIPDGVGLVWAARFLGQPLHRRIPGTDLMEKLCREASRRGWSVYLLGAKPGVAKKALAVLKRRYPGLKGWAESGPVIKNSGLKKKEALVWVKKINEKRPTFLFVAFGMGKQEKFIFENWKAMEVKLAMGVGGAFDYLSGTVPRAPVWIRKIGFEWFYRLFRQPWRGRRQLALIKFVWLILLEKLSLIKS